MYLFRIVGMLAFCPPHLSFTPSGQISRARLQQLNLSDRGWDNGNYLDALGGGKESIDEANAKYERESQARASMRERKFQSMAHDVKFQEVLDIDQGDDNDVLVGGIGEESPIPVPNVGIDENPSGGDRFRRMMEQANSRPGQVTDIRAQQQAQDQMQQQPVPIQNPTPLPQQAPPLGQQNMDPQGYYKALQTWQQAMVAFQQFSAANPDAASKMTPPPPPPPPPTFTQQMPQQAIAQQQYQTPVPQQQKQYSAPQQQPQQQPNQTKQSDGSEKTVYDYLPTRAGGNKDAYEVNNSADLYFAQLKRDSTIRTEARKRGDLETANSPFSEEGVIALGGFFSEELIERRREQLAKNGGEFETSRDEMLLPQHFGTDNDPNQDVDKAYPGTSYKQKLMESRKNKAQN